MSFNTRPSHCKNMKHPLGNLAPSAHFRMLTTCTSQLLRNRQGVCDGVGVFQLVSELL